MFGIELVWSLLVVWTQTTFKMKPNIYYKITLGHDSQSRQTMNEVDSHSLYHKLLNQLLSWSLQPSWMAKKILTFRDLILQLPTANISHDQNSSESTIQLRALLYVFCHKFFYLLIKKKFISFQLITDFATSKNITRTTWQFLMFGNKGRHKTRFIWLSLHQKN